MPRESSLHIPIIKVNRKFFKLIICNKYYKPNKTYLGQIPDSRTMGKSGCSKE